MRIATWNMQGGTNTPYILQVVNATQSNVLCLQECGNLATLLQGRVPLIDPASGAIIGYTGNLVLGHGFMECVYWENNDWIQGGLAILSNIGYGGCGILAAGAMPGFVPNNVRNLPWMRVFNSTLGVDITIFSIHAPPVYDGTTIANVCNWNNLQIAQIAALVVGGSWACVGDFNADPTAPGYIAPAPFYRVVHGLRATQQGGGILDYAMTNMAPPFVYINQTNLVGASDHYPQVFGC